MTEFPSLNATITSTSTTTTIVTKTITFTNHTATSTFTNTVTAATTVVRTQSFDPIPWLLVILLMGVIMAIRIFYGTRQPKLRPAIAKLSALAVIAIIVLAFLGGVTFSGLYQQSQINNLPQNRVGTTTTTISGDACVITNPGFYSSCTIRGGGGGGVCGSPCNGFWNSTTSITATNSSTPVPIIIQSNSSQPYIDNNHNPLTGEYCSTGWAWQGGASFVCFYNQKPLAIILDFGNKSTYYSKEIGNATTFIDGNFSARLGYLLNDAMNSSAKTVIIKIDSTGGFVGGVNDAGTTMRKYQNESGMKIIWYVPHICKSGCFVLSTYADKVFLQNYATWEFGHSKAELGASTFDWANKTLSANGLPIDSLGTFDYAFIAQTAYKSPFMEHRLFYYVGQDFTTFMATPQFKDYKIETVQA